MSRENLIAQQSNAHRKTNTTTARIPHTFSFNSATGGFRGSESSADGFGGAIGNLGILSVTKSTFDGNSATGIAAGGGAIFNPGMLSVTKSTFTRNSTKGTLGSDGGGIHNSGTLSVTKSTFAGNSAGGLYGDGGGINNFGTLSVTNSTLSGNSATGVDGSFGGAIADTGKVSITYVTADDNSAATGGGVAIVSLSGSVVDSIDSIFANSQGGNIGITAGSFRSLGHNLFSDDPAVTLEATDLINTTPFLGPLAKNGGPTLTQALLPGSPAIDARIFIAGITTDQRGAPRRRGRATDIGAFEVQSTRIVGDPRRVRASTDA